METFSQDNGVTNGFIRQRRNLIIISLCLLFYDSFGLDLKKVSILGNELYVQNHDLLPTVLWIIYTYFLIRYYQYFNDLYDRGIATKYRIQVNQSLINWAYAKGKKDYIVENKINNTTKYKFGVPESHFSEIEAWKIEIEGKANVLMTTKINSGIDTRNANVAFRYVANWVVIIRCKIQSIFHVCFRTHLVSEYYLPFIIAITLLIWRLYKSIWLTSA